MQVKAWKTHRALCDILLENKKAIERERAAKDAPLKEPPPKGAGAGGGKRPLIEDITQGDELSGPLDSSLSNSNALATAN